MSGRQAGTAAVTVSSSDDVEGHMAVATVLSGALDGKAPSPSKRAPMNMAPKPAADIVTCPYFASGTTVMTPSGPVAIEQLRVGDWVLSRDDETGDTAPRLVDEVFVTPAKDLVELLLADADGEVDTVQATPGHPFWVEGRGWTLAGDLDIGDRIETADEPSVEVVGAASLAATQTVYNLEVRGYHTYFVGDDGAWVHNICDCGRMRGSAVEDPVSGGKMQGASWYKGRGKADNKPSGSCTNTHASGKKYHGKGGQSRSQQSGERIATEHNDPHVATDWTPARNSREGFKDESRRLDADGGHRSATNYNKIEQPGKRFRSQDGEP